MLDGNFKKAERMQWVGSDRSYLERRTLAFDQVLKFIRTIRSSGRRPVTFIRISRTGLTTDMVRKIFISPLLN